MIAAHCECILLCSVLTLWSGARLFALSLPLSRRGEQTLLTLKKLDFQTPQTLSWDDVRNRYEAVKDLAYGINKAFGHLMTCFLVKVILYYPISLNKIADWIKAMITLMYFLGGFSMLLFSVDTCRHVKVTFEKPSIN